MIKMSNSCIVITGDAYGSFLVNEMTFLSCHFRTVYVFAYNAIHGKMCNIEYPSNVKVFCIGVASGVKRFAKYVPIGLKRTHRDLKIKSWRPMPLLASLYARGRADYVFRFILSKLEHATPTDGVVYSYWFTDHAIVAWRIAEELKLRGGKFKAYSRAHGYDLYWERNASGYLPFQDVSLAHLDGVFPCSDCGTRYLASKYPEYAGKIRTARLGTWDYGVGPEPKAEVNFVTCSRLIDVKRVELFAEAFCKFWETDHNCHWFCIGDGERRPEIEGIVRECNAGAAVSMLGAMQNKEIMDFYKKNPVSWFVNVSSSEGVPVSIMEAMSFGIPIIATDVGGSGELVSDECGKLIPAEIGVAGLLNILSNSIRIGESEYRQKRKNARAVWEKKASAEKNYEAWCRVLMSK